MKTMVNFLLLIQYIYACGIHTDRHGEAASIHRHSTHMPYITYHFEYDDTNIYSFEFILQGCPVSIFNGISLFFIIFWFILI